MEENEYPVLHISNVALPANAPNGKYYLTVSMGKDIKDLTIASLEKNKNEVQALDLYINVSQGVTLSSSGPGELHLSGFFEPHREEMDEDGMFFDDEADEDEDEAEEAGSLNKSLKEAKKNALKNSHLPRGGSSDEDDEDEEDEDDLEEDDDESEDEAPQLVKGKP